MGLGTWVWKTETKWSEVRFFVVLWKHVTRLGTWVWKTGTECSKVRFFQEVQDQYLIHSSDGVMGGGGVGRLSFLFGSQTFWHWISILRAEIAWKIPPSCFYLSDLVVYKVNSQWIARKHPSWQQYLHLAQKHPRSGTELPYPLSENNLFDVHQTLNPPLTWLMWCITAWKVVEQAEDEDEGCGSNNCENPLMPGEMVECAGPSCHTQVINIEGHLMANILFPVPSDMSASLNKCFGMVLWWILLLWCRLRRKKHCIQAYWLGV